jgi:hypothetical protein
MYDNTQLLTTNPLAQAAVYGMDEMERKNSIAGEGL